MKRLLPVIIFMFPPVLMAQGGGFGHFGIGLANSGFGTLAEDLSVPSLMGSVSLKSTGTYIGGGGFGVIGKHLMLGGKGYAGAFGQASGAKGTVETGHAWGFFNAGYLLPAPRGIFGYVYGGIGGGGASAKITNNSGNTWEFGGFQIKDGQTGTLGTGGMGIDVGLGLFRFLPEEAGGFKVGLEIGYSSGLGNQLWNNGDKEANNLRSWNPGMLYFTLCIGGGAIAR